MKKEEILTEIKRLATKSDGKPPGKRLFETETGITEGAWVGKYWARWSEALVEAGFTPNEWNPAFEEQFVFEKLAAACRYYGRIPVRAEFRLYRRNVDSEFPDDSIILRRFGSKEKMLAEFANHAKGRPEFDDIAKLIGDRISNAEDHENTSTLVEGHVYLIKMGKHYKIGRTGNIERRFKEVKTNLPEKGDIVHVIRTDDPSGIEAYWHGRFADKRAPNGEWFSLTSTDVKIFKKRKFM